MRRSPARWAWLLVPVAIAVLASILAWRANAPAVSEAVVPGDRVRAAAEGLATSNLWVADDAAGRLTPEQQDDIAAAAAAADPEVFVVVWTSSYAAGYRSPFDAADQIATLTGRPGQYLVVGSGTDMADESFGVQVACCASSDMTGRLDKAILRYVAEVDSLGPDPDSSTTSGYWGGPVSSTMAGVLFGALAFGGFMIVFGIVVLVVNGRSRRLSTKD